MKISEIGITSEARVVDSSGATETQPQRLNARGPVEDRGIVRPSRKLEEASRNDWSIGNLGKIDYPG